MTHTCTKVTVRQRAIRNNRISLYLDYYPAVRNPETMQMSRRGIPRHLHLCPPEKRNGTGVQQRYVEQSRGYPLHQSAIAYQ